MTATPINRTSKELARHSVTRSGILGRFSILARKALGRNAGHVLLSSLADRFSAVYANRFWLNGSKCGSLSGLGPEVRTTAGIRGSFSNTLVSLSAQVLLDIGHGDFTWIKELNLPCQYIGVDIVPSVIALNAGRYGSQSRRFKVLDVTRDSLPPSDTVLCREVMFHLSFQDIWRLVENVRSCGARFIIATNDPGLTMNADIVSGEFRMLNLEKAPFRFPRPALSMQDDSVCPGRFLSVWEVSALPPSPQTYGVLAQAWGR